MTIEVDTKDTTALSDAELAEMADICADQANGFDVGMLSKQAQEWVLATQARLDDRLVGFAFATLERIGGTPSLLLGLAAFAEEKVKEEVLVGILTDQYRRALLAFPDEDVLVGVRMCEPTAFYAFGGLTEIVPRPDHRATGEERAWGRRLAKRFGADGRIDDRSFVLSGSGSPAPVLDFHADNVGSEEDLDAFFSELDSDRGDCLVAFGWAMAEDLAAGTLPMVKRS